MIIRTVDAQLGSGLRVASPTAQGSKAVMMQGRGGWNRWGVEDNYVVGHKYCLHVYIL